MLVVPDQLLKKHQHVLRFFLLHVQDIVIDVFGGTEDPLESSHVRVGLGTSICRQPLIKTFTFSSCRVRMPNPGNGVRMFSHPQTGGPRRHTDPGFPEGTAMSRFKQLPWEEAHWSSA